MQNSLSKNSLMKLWNDVEKEYKIKLVIHDHFNFFTFSDGTLLLPKCNIHNCVCCIYDNNDRKSCLDHCKTWAMRTAFAKGTSFHSCCWRGINEVIMPIYQEKTHIATIFAGSFRDEKFSMNKFDKRYKTMYNSLPIWKEQYLDKLTNVLLLIGYSLLQMAENLKGQYEFPIGRKERITNFLENHLEEKLTVAVLAKNLCLSESRTIHLVKELFNENFTNILTKIRIKKAEQLLQNGFNLKEVARLTGFKNEYYFNKIFKKYVGISPGLYQQKVPYSYP